MISNNKIYYIESKDNYNNYNNKKNKDNNDHSDNKENKELFILKKPILPSKSYTRVNVVLCSIALIVKNQTLYSICYSNSLAILISFQSTCLVAPKSYNNLLKKYTSNFIFWFLNILSHYVPIFIFNRLTDKRYINFKSVSCSCLLQLLWGKSINWDINKIYKINPPLNNIQKYKLWFLAAISHYLIYLIKIFRAPWLFPFILPLSKRSLFNFIFKKKIQ